MAQVYLPKLITECSEKPLELEEHEALTDQFVSQNKTPLTSGMLSGLFPGLGQMYTHKDTKAFLYMVASFTGAAVIGFLLIVGNLSDGAIAAIAKLLENLPLFDITFSQKTYDFVEKLRFPNPFTLSIIAVNLVYTGFVVWDAFSSASKIQNREYESVPYYKQENIHESTAVSYAIHALALLIVLISSFLFVQPKKPDIQITQIEYIPTQRASKIAPPKETKRRAAKQSIDAGKNDPKKPVAPVTKPAGKPKLAPKPKPTPKPAAQQPKPKPAAPKKPVFQPFKKSVPKPRPSSRPTKDVPTQQPKRYIPAPSTYKSSPSASNSASSPTPKSVQDLATGDAGARSSDLVARLSSIPRIPLGAGEPGNGGAFGSGKGNPGPNLFPNQPPSVAARADVDFGPYMSALQRKIKLAWKPPRGKESNRIVIIFSVARNGTLSDLEIYDSAGDPLADQAAMDAVRRSAPFKPLPDGAPDVIDIEFTFDYNVYKEIRR